MNQKYNKSVLQIIPEEIFIPGFLGLSHEPSLNLEANF